MKTFYLLLFLPCLCFAQKKGDNTIKINAVVPSSLLKEVLFNSGYSIESSDTFYLTTSARELPKNVISLKIMVAKKDSTTIFKALYKSGLMVNTGMFQLENQFASLTFGGAKNSSYRKAWEELDRIVKLISSNIIYLKQ